MAIRSFHSRALRRLYEAGDARGIRPDRVARIRNIVFALDEARAVSDMGLFPGWRLHPLSGNLKGFWSVTVSGNWRVIFRFAGGHAYDVDLVDYH